MSSLPKSFENILQDYLPEKELNFVHKLLYGQVSPLDLGQTSENLKVQGFSLVNENNSERGQRVRRIGLCQMLMTLPTTESVLTQKAAAIDLGLKFLRRAADAQAQFFCFQELWTMPMGFCTGEKLPWVEFAEDALHGETTTRLQPLAKAYNMVIVSPILERDSNDELWNSAVVIDATGDVLGTYRKCHIPTAGNESIFFRHSNQNSKVFQTKFGKVGVSLCYDRHFPAHWYMLRLLGAEIVFNPCASVASFSEHLWLVEAKAAAVACGFHVAAINRVGLEVFQDSRGGEKQRPFYGSSFAISPSGNSTPGLPTDRSGLLVVDLDLAECRSYQNGYRTFGETATVLYEISQNWKSF